VLEAANSTASERDKSASVGLLLANDGSSVFAIASA